ncbi:MAG: hypothetical protein AAGD14_02040 [Planctomycetota bacterium]
MTLSRIATVAVVHFVLTLICVIVGFGEIWGERTALQEVAMGVGEVLVRPGAWLWTRWASHNLPDILEWALVIANSFLWASVIVWGWRARADRVS